MFTQGLPRTGEIPICASTWNIAARDPRFFQRGQVRYSLERRKVAIPQSDDFGSQQAHHHVRFGGRSVALVAD